MQGARTCALLQPYCTADDRLKNRHGYAPLPQEVNALESKLNLNFELVEKARAHASRVADDTQLFIDRHTTVAVERTVCRLLGIDGVNDFEVPLPNVM